MRHHLSILAILGTITIATVILYVLPGSGFSSTDSPRSHAAVPVFAVTAKPNKTRIKLREPFEVRLRVLNQSGVRSSIRVMNCSWDEHWKSSNGQVSPILWDCAKNFAVTIWLDPGQAYEKTMQMMLLQGKPGEKVPLKMAFTPIGSKTAFWSEEIDLEVVAR